MPGLAIYKIFYFSVLYPIEIILLALTLFFTFLLYLTNKGRIKEVSVLLILVTWIALTLMAAYSDGVKDIPIVMSVDYTVLNLIKLLFLIVSARLKSGSTDHSEVPAWVRL